MHDRWKEVHPETGDAGEGVLYCVDGAGLFGHLSRPDPVKGVVKRMLEGIYISNGLHSYTRTSPALPPPLPLPAWRHCYLQ